ncbi:MAG: HAD-IIIA family hydrolase [Phycisphaerae bacterium]
MVKKAVFLDRDDTILKDPGYLSDPERVELLPGVALAIKSLRQAGFMVVVVTNQSGIARGMLTEETLRQIHEEMRRRLDSKGAHIDAIYYCPYHPDGSVIKYARNSDLRKPRPGMILQAARELNIDLKQSWMVGDGARDVEAGQRAGCRTIRIRHEEHHRPGEPEQETVQADFNAQNLVEAARIISREGSTEPATVAAGAVATAMERSAAENGGADRSSSGSQLGLLAFAEGRRDREASEEEAWDTSAEEGTEPDSPAGEDEPPVVRDEQLPQPPESEALPEPPAKPELPRKTGKPTPGSVRLGLTPEVQEPSEQPAAAETSESPAAEPARAEPAQATDAPVGVPAGATTNESHRAREQRFRREVLQRLDRLIYGSEEEAFSITKLLAGLTQGLTLMMLFVTFWKLLGSAEAIESVAWGLIAVVFQVMALTFFVMNRER